MSEAKSQFIFVLGPTASGKSDLAMHLAQRLSLPIINCDSVQVFSKTLIGTAQPSVADRQAVRHFLFQYVEPPLTPTVADYLRDVEELLKTQEINKALFVGGSGFYIQALEKGLYPESETAPEVLREVEQIWQEWGPQKVYQWIKERDPVFAKKISANDHYRTKRALAVMKSQNRTMTELKSVLQMENHSILPPHQVIKVGLNDSRENLRKRVRERTQQMLRAGWIDEVKELRSQGWQSWAPMLSVGYKEVQAHIDGEISVADLPDRIVTATMQLIKKQQTWFKRDASIQWFTPDEWRKAVDWALDRFSPTTP